MAQLQFASGDTLTWAEKFGNGGDGALTISADTTETVTDSACTGTSGTTSLSATNASFAANQIIFIHQTQGTGVGNWQLNVIQSYTAGTITTKYALTNTYATGAQVRVVNQNADITINTTKTLTAKAWDGTVGGLLVLMSNGTTTVTGNITSSGSGFRGTDTAYQGANQPHHRGEGTTVGSYNATYSTTGAAGGGGGAGTESSGVYHGGGGGGSHATSGGNGGSTSGAGGGSGATDTLGNAALTLASFGGSGGASASSGKKSGAFILIISKTLTVTGTINGNGVTGTTTPNSYTGGDGSGAGGSILLKGQTLTLGTTLVTAAGGLATAAGGGGGAGGVGGTGRIHADYLTSISGTTTPTLDSAQDSTLSTGTTKDNSSKSNSKTTYYSGCNYDWSLSTGVGKNRGFNS